MLNKTNPAIDQRDDFVTIWRIATEAPTYKADDLSGAGAKITGGRWNNVGTAVVYCATSIALATLETVYFLRTGALPFNRYLVRVDVPMAVWSARQVLDPFPGGWDAIPAGLTSRTTGDKWITSNTTALLVVPSVIVPQECNVLLNPQHPQASSIKATTLDRWTFDPRLFPSSPVKQ